MKKWRYLWRTSSSLQLFRSINLKWWPLLITAFFVFTLRHSESPTVLKFLSHRFPIDAVFQMKHPRIVITFVQIGVTTALNLPGTAKGEFFFPVEPKGAKGFHYKIRDFLNFKISKIALNISSLRAISCEPSIWPRYFNSTSMLNSTFNL